MRLKILFAVLLLLLFVGLLLGASTAKAHMKEINNLRQRVSDLEVVVNQKMVDKVIVGPEVRKKPPVRQLDNDGYM